MFFDMSRTMCEIVSFSGVNDFLYQGAIFWAKNSDITVIHVHGSCGNFLSFKPIVKVATSYVKQGINFLSFNTKGHDCISEGFFGEKYEYVGGSITKFDNCIVDIQSAIDFCKTFSSKIILQGHSLGCDRIVYYQRRTKNYYPTILISPCDSYALQRNYLMQRKLSVEDQIEFIRKSSRNKFEILSLKEYGVNNKGESYFIPIARSALLSIMTGPPFKQFRVDKPLRYHIYSPCFLCIGEKDKLQTSDFDSMVSILEPRFDTLDSILVADSDHEIEPCIEKFNEAVYKWIKSIIFN